MILSNLDDYTQALLKAVIRGSRLLHADKALEIYSIENRHAARFWLTDSRWCVRDNPWLEDYLEQGPLLLMRSTKRSRDYLLAPANGEFRNSRNRRVSILRFIDEHPDSYLALRRLGVYWDIHQLQKTSSENIQFVPTNVARSFWKYR